MGYLLHDMLLIILYGRESEKLFCQQQSRNNNHQAARNPADILRRARARPKHRAGAIAHKQVDHAATDHMYQPQRYHLQRKRPGSVYVGELWQQSQKQQKDLWIKPADAKAPERPLQSRAGIVTLPRRRCGRVAEHAYAEPEQIASPSHGQKGQHARRSRNDRADSRCHYECCNKMAAQHTGNCWYNTASLDAS